MDRLLRQFGRTFSMLLIAVMVVIPVSEAFSCALESDSAHSLEVVLDDDALPLEEGDADERLHGACAHNHCHHATANVPSDVATGQFPFKRGCNLPLQDDSRLASVSDGLMRPPRI